MGKLIINAGGIAVEDDSFRTKFKEYLSEYSSNTDFKEIIESGNFVFVDKRLVINNKKYIQRDSEGKLSLTSYARRHPDECCLSIELKRPLFNKYEDIQADDLDDMLYDDKWLDDYPRYRSMESEPRSVASPPSLSKRGKVYKNRDLFQGMITIMYYIVAGPFLLLWFLIKAIASPFRYSFKKLKKMLFLPDEEDYWDYEDYYDDDIHNSDYEDYESLPTHRDQAKPDRRTQPISKFPKDGTYEDSGDTDFPDGTGVAPSPVQRQERNPKLDFVPPRKVHADSKKSVNAKMTAEHNMEVFERADELRKMSSALLTMSEDALKDKKTFAQLAWENITRVHCAYKDIFCTRTLLSDKTFIRIRDGKVLNPEIETAVAICVGLNLGSFYSMPLLESAGIDLKNTAVKLYQAYYVLICTCHHLDILECNKVLELAGFKPIRENEYRKFIGDSTE